MRARTRWILIVIALGAAVCLAIAVQGGRWWHAANISIGPGGTSVCFPDGCRNDDLSWLPGTEVWRKAGLATMAASLLATLCLALLAGSLAARRTGTLAAGATLTATLTSAVAGSIFLVEFPGAGPGLPASMGAGVVLWLVGLVTAATCAVFILQRRGGPGQ